jgi:hypothetical protein
MGHEDSVGKLPHIVCVLGAGRWATLGMDQFMNSRMSDGRRIHTDLMPMTIAYHCMAKEGLVARRIAWYASMYTNVFRRIIMRSGHLQNVSTGHDISAESPPTAFTGPTVDTDIVAVVVTVPFYWQPQWRITKPAELWNSMRMEFNVDQVRSMYSAGIKQAQANGLPVTSKPIDAVGTAYTQSVHLNKKEE